MTPGAALIVAPSAESDSIQEMAVFSRNVKVVVAVAVVETFMKTFERTKCLLMSLLFLILLVMLLLLLRRESLKGKGEMGEDET